MIKISPESVQQIISADFPRRLKSFPRKSVSDIFRYGAFVGHAIEEYQTAERCMELARLSIARAEDSGTSFSSGLTIVAEQLTSGKGRFLRQWHAPVGGIWLALTIVNNLLPQYASFLPMAAGVACCETVRSYGIPAQIKWVNDVHVDGRKLAGILAETMVGRQSGEEYVIVGIGLNVNNRKFPDFLADGAGAMRDYLAADLDLAEVTARLLANLSWNIGLLYYHEQQELSSFYTDKERFSGNPLLASFRKLSDTVGRRVNYGFNVVSDPQYSGKVIEINEAGSIVVQLADGTTVTEAGGEIIYL